MLSLKFVEMPFGKVLKNMTLQLIDGSIGLKIPIQINILADMRYYTISALDQFYYKKTYGSKGYGLRMTQP